MINPKEPVKYKQLAFLIFLSNKINLFTKIDINLLGLHNTIWRIQKDISFKNYF